ncbi:MAG: BREX-1 system adenine-specific DNA-methyltransferase PglX [Chloroflexi bacterium]|nr:BREX-1 system adenine-specific DNA-methyltransferase PglX [Chloroflexota bacterium]
MAALIPSLYPKVENTIIAAREAAERGARDALIRLDVDGLSSKPPAHLSPAETKLHQALRAKMKALGQKLDDLAPEIAYEQWHRMLFARFLAENHLLIHPDGIPVTLAECNELAAEEGAPDGWSLAARYAARMLPQIFRVNDPVLQVTLAPEHRQRLEKLLADLPIDLFTADDGLGWVYQFWQSKRKDEVNARGDKIGGADLAPVTQLFTEDYMVQFLLHNTIGAWAVGRGLMSVERIATDPATFITRPLALPYLRFLDDGTPAAGTFPGWPDRIADLRLMDPCGGSGHFLVAEFNLLVDLRLIEAEREGQPITEHEAADAVLRDNLHMLELDPRCTQIAAFALALAAWKRGGFRQLPELNIACSGVAPGADKRDWLALAGKDKALREGMGLLYDLFQQAPDLGSLITPNKLKSWAVRFDELRDLLARALSAEAAATIVANTERNELGIAAQGITKAAELLVGQYHLVATNVPFLKSINQSVVLATFCSEAYPQAKTDLATVFLLRCLEMCKDSGSIAVVTPRHWYYLGSYNKLRKQLLVGLKWDFIAPLGPHAFRTISGEVVNVTLSIISNEPPFNNSLYGLDVSNGRDPDEKAQLLQFTTLHTVEQSAQLENPDARIILSSRNEGDLLGRYANAYAGIRTGDYTRFGRCFWELPRLDRGWVFQHSTVVSTTFYGGCEHILLWESGKGQLASYQAELAEKRYASGGWKQGWQAWGKRGVAISQMTNLQATLYTGELFDNNTAVVLPTKATNLPAIWAFCSSPEYAKAVRKIDQKLNVTNATLVKVPFELEYWQKVAAECYPNGLPEPHSDDPTQWLFKSNIADSTAPLQVAVAQLLGYRWPEDNAEHRAQKTVGLIDSDGIVCIPVVSGEPLAAERLRALLATAYGSGWSAARQGALLVDVGFEGRSLDQWLRDGFFAQHCKLFHQRPFIWHIWDGRRDGFAALVNYHKLDRRLLERLTYTYLGDWIRRQQDAVKQEEDGAEARLRAAQALQEKLKLILEGEPPYDIYVRWKPLHEQPLGWEPDLNDGVRLNIRPFVAAGVLRTKPNIHWNKDRGKNPDGSERLNDLHFTIAEKHLAREKNQRSSR